MLWFSVLPNDVNVSSFWIPLSDAILNVMPHGLSDNADVEDVEKVFTECLMNFFLQIQIFGSICFPGYSCCHWFYIPPISPFEKGLVSFSGVTMF